jgi:hypothetical protein
MAVLGLRDAARQVGVHRSSIHRAIRAGRLSATRTETGDYHIDPAELFRVYPPKPSVARQSETVRTEQDALSPETPETGETTALCVQIATLKAENAALRTLGERERLLLEDALEHARSERDRWAAQAERLALAGPPRRSWWPWRRST